MSTVKNLNVNKKSNNLNKRLKLFVTASAVLLVGSVSFFVANDVIAANDLKEERNIVEHYGVDSLEFKILDYIDISKILSELKLDEYIADNSLYEGYFSKVLNV